MPVTYYFGRPWGENNAEPDFYTETELKQQFYNINSVRDFEGLDLEKYINDPDRSIKDLKALQIKLGNVDGVIVRTSPQGNNGVFDLTYLNKILSLQIELRKPVLKSEQTESKSKEPNQSFPRKKKMLPQLGSKTKYYFLTAHTDPDTKKTIYAFTMTNPKQRPNLSSDVAYVDLFETIEALKTAKDVDGLKTLKTLINEKNGLFFVNNTDQKKMAKSELIQHIENAIKAAGGDLNQNKLESNPQSAPPPPYFLISKINPDTQKKTYQFTNSEEHKNSCVDLLKTIRLLKERHKEGELLELDSIVSMMKGLTFIQRFTPSDNTVKSFTAEEVRNKIDDAIKYVESMMGKIRLNKKPTVTAQQGFFSPKPTSTNPEPPPAPSPKHN